MPSLPIGKTSTEALVRAAKRGDEDAIETLVLTHGPVRGVIEKLKKECDPSLLARGWEPKPLPRKADEAEAAARVGVLEALNRFDSDRGVRFTTFAYPFIKGAILRALYVKVRRSAGPDREIPTLVGLDSGDENSEVATVSSFEAELLGRDSGYGEDLGYRRVLIADERAEIRDFVRNLPPTQNDILRQIFWEGRSQDEVASDRGVTRQAVSKVLNKALAYGRDQFDSSEIVAA